MVHPNIQPFIGVDARTFQPYLCMVSPWQENGSILTCIEWLERILGVPVLLDFFVRHHRRCYIKHADVVHVRSNKPLRACGTFTTTISSTVICTLFVTCSMACLSGRLTSSYPREMFSLTVISLSSYRTLGWQHFMAEVLRPRAQVFSARFGSVRPSYYLWTARSCLCRWRVTCTHLGVFVSRCVARLHFTLLRLG